MPVVWGVFPWKNLVLASDMNSGLWVFRVTEDAIPDNGATTTTAPLIAPQPRPAPPRDSGDSGDSGGFLWVGLAGLVLGLLAVGVVVRAARRPG
jgi:hypothetical protein